MIPRAGYFPVQEFGLLLIPGIKWGVNNVESYLTSGSCCSLSRSASSPALTPATASIMFMILQGVCYQSYVNYHSQQVPISKQSEQIRILFRFESSIGKYFPWI